MENRTRGDDSVGAVGAGAGGSPLAYAPRMMDVVITPDPAGAASAAIAAELRAVVSRQGTASLAVSG